MVDVRKEDCCGCGACEQICPKHCIVMQYDAEGFGYPKVNREKCIDCHLCQASCPVKFSKQKSSLQEVEAYAAYCKDETTRINSSSGGIFSLLAEWVICQNGVVFGAAFDDNWTVHHVAVESIDSIYKLQGSKYLQSRTENTYLEVKQHLLAGRKVLYTGTPCEIEGLKAYLRREYKNLYTQDIICHGAPSPKLWKKYVEYHERIAGERTEKIYFRHKKYGWKKYAVVFEFSNNKVYERIARDDSFMKMFLQNICLRPSCYNCSFKRINRQSDITLSDFWGCDNVCPEMDDDKGCSLVMVHSTKGKELMNGIKDRMVYKTVDATQALVCNPSMTNSSPKPRLREEFMAQIDTLGIEELAKKYLLRSKIKSCISRMLPQKLRRELAIWLEHIKK